jgi:hypothetical protein
MIDFLAAASISAVMRQDFPDTIQHRLVREQPRRTLALHEAYSLLLTRWQRPPRADLTLPLIPPL